MGWHSDLLIVHHHWQLSWTCACSRSKVPIAPMGFSHVLRLLVLAGWRCAHQRWHGELLMVHHHGQQSFQCACSRSKVPIAPMGILLTCLRRLVLAQLRTLRSTTAGTCHRDLAISHRPDGNFICFALVLAGRRCVHLQCHSELLIVHHHEQHSSISLRSNTECTCRRDFKTSHRPDGIFTCLRLLVLAGRRCLCREWHGELLIVHHYRQQRCLCACSRSKLPIAPVGRWLTCPNRLSSFNSDRYLVLSGTCTCQPHLLTSHRPDGGEIADVLANLAP